MRSGTCPPTVVGDADQIGQERRRRLRERDPVTADRVERDLGVPALLDHLGGAEPPSDPHAVQPAGLVRQRRRDVDHVVGAQTEVRDVRVGGAVEHLVAVQHSLRLAGRARGEQQLGDRRRRRPACRDGRLVGFRASDSGSSSSPSTSRWRTAGSSTISSRAISPWS